ncbi:hypothetical protein SE17_13485 [Kouleothrix aurantiaca]|uniref:Uncharacterized protein n=1 Tax=Kouleothrix aurantiaca TaxID=186479 RepID=A0A0P9DAM4_9CHLR|nr:hypothetical protein SE17_13485 [Kouleothrix aurantiaca]
MGIRLIVIQTFGIVVNIEYIKCTTTILFVVSAHLLQEPGQKILASMTLAIRIAAGRVPVVIPAATYRA